MILLAKEEGDYGEDLRIQVDKVWNSSGNIGL
jgi:hypothetical protein